MIDPHSTTASRCAVCGSAHNEPLQPPHPSRSITSGGIILDTPLRNVQCLDCGVSWQRVLSDTFRTDLYQNKYAFYHRRPGTSAYESARYAAMAGWILAELAPFAPSSVLDVGCGGGFLLQAMKLVHPSAEYDGVDPSVENSALARSRGFAVATGFVPGTAPPRAQYDLVTATNVMSHITDPEEFLRALVAMIAPDGRIVIYFHDGSEPGADLLWTDVACSFSREHIALLGSKVGLEMMEGRHLPRPEGQLDKDVLIFRRSQPSASASVQGLDLARKSKLLEQRRRYFSAWHRAADRLTVQTRAAHGPILNFGASFWSMLLATYCPEYWDRVEACVVDEKSDGCFFGKPVIATETISSEPKQLIVLGVNPSTQDALAARLSRYGQVVRWNDLITR